MNRILTLVATSLLALFLTACGEEKNTVTVKPEDGKTTEVQVEHKADDTKAVDQQTMEEPKSE